MWLIHLVGDVHQPFHAVSEERGGNQIAVTYFGRPTNLHAVWDSDLVRQSRRASADYAAYLERTQLSGAHLDVLTSGTAIEWALESRDIGLRALVQSGAEIEENYVARFPRSGATTRACRGAARRDFECNFGLGA